MKSLLIYIHNRVKKSQKKWVRDCELVDVEDLDWESIYLLPRICTLSTKLRNFQCVFFILLSLSQFTPVFSNPLPLLITALIGNVLRTIDISFSEANSIVSSEFGTLRIAENLVVNHAKFDTPFTLYAFNLISKRLYQHP